MILCMITNTCTARYICPLTQCGISPESLRPGIAYAYERKTPLRRSWKCLTLSQYRELMILIASSCNSLKPAFKNLTCKPLQANRPSYTCHRLRARELRCCSWDFLYSGDRLPGLLDKLQIDWALQIEGTAVVFCYACCMQRPIGWADDQIIEVPVQAFRKSTD